MLRYCLKPSHKLLDKAQYQSVFDRVDCKAGSGPLLILARASSNTEHPRIGLIVRKKNIKLSVNRSLVKRIIREQFRLHQYELPHCDMIVMTRGSFEGLTKQQIANRVNQAFTRLNKSWKPVTNHD